MKFLKWLGIILGSLLAILLLLGFLLHERKPEANPSKEADALAQKMLDALHQEAWDSTQYLQWTFREKNNYFWDKQRNWVEVSWDNIKVLLHTKTVSGQAYQDGNLLTPDEATDYIQTAWSNFCNDSYWLAAPMKVMDEGTTRSIVQLKDGREGLMIQYQSGGVTPGDAYVWMLDEAYRPEAFKMWVKIIPIGGIEASWGAWEPIQTGALIARQRLLLGKAEIPLTNVIGANNLEAFKRTSDPFIEAERNLNN